MRLKNEPGVIEFRLIRTNQPLFAFAESEGVFAGIDSQQSVKSKIADQLQISRPKSCQH